MGYLFSLATKFPRSLASRFPSSPVTKNQGRTVARFLRKPVIRSQSTTATRFPGKAAIRYPSRPATKSQRKTANNFPSRTATRSPRPTARMSPGRAAPVLLSTRRLLRRSAPPKVMAARLPLSHTADTRGRPSRRLRITLTSRLSCPQALTPFPTPR
jgi:hypothetical protein